MFNEDKDIKIFTKSSKKDNNEDVLSIADIMNKHRENGNLDKAKKLGEDLALMSVNKVVSIPYIEELYLSGDECDFVQYQASILLVFSARRFLGRNLDEALISVSMSALYNKLIDISPEWFKNLSGGTEISFYTLELSRDGAGALQIGRCFAKLCKQDDNERFISYGEKLFNFMEKTIIKMIKQENFIEV